MVTSPGRVQAPDLNLRPQLQPAAIPRVAMVSPVNMQGAGSNLMNIAESLSGLSSSLGDYGVSQRVAADKKAENAAKKVQFWTPEAIAQIPEAGTDAVQAVVGRSTANFNIGPTLQNYILKEWDPAVEPDLTKALTSRLMDEQSKLPSEAAQEAFGQSITPWVQSAVNGYNQLLADTTEQNTQTMLFRDLIGINEANKDKPIADRVKLVHEAMGEYRFLKVVDPKYSNTLLLTVAKHFAEQGDRDMVDALVNTYRGTDGKVPPLSQIPDFADKMPELLSMADSKWADTHSGDVNRFYADIDGVVQRGSEMELTALINSERGRRVLVGKDANSFLRTNLAQQRKNMQDRVVTNELMTGEQTRTAAYIEALRTGNGPVKWGKVTVTTSDGKTREIDRDAEAQSVFDKRIVAAGYENVDRADPLAVATADKGLARIVINTPYKVTEWTDIFDVAAKSVVPQQLLEGKIPPQLERAYGLYKNLRDQPQLRKEHMSDGDQNLDTFFQFAMMNEERGLPDAAAMNAAARLVYGPNSEALLGAARGRVTEAIYGQRSEVQVRDYPIEVQNQIVTSATAIAANGLSPVDAVKRAETEFKASFAEIDVGGGKSFLKKPQRNTPDAWGENIAKYVEKQIELNGAKSNPPIDIDQIKVFDNGNGHYSLITEDGMMLPTIPDNAGGKPKPGSFFFTYSDVEKFIGAESAAEDLKAKTGVLNSTSQNNTLNQELNAADGPAGFDINKVGGNPFE